MIIEDLDATLAMMLHEDLKERFPGQVQISFAAPDNDFPPQSVTVPAVDLFLYDVRENLELRSNEVIVARDDRTGRLMQRQPAVRVDFSYLVTAWPSESQADPWTDEHRLLGAVMQCLLRHRTLPQPLLQGALKVQDPPVPVSSLQPGRLQSVGEFWQAMGGKPKAALHYTVTVAIDLDDGRPLELVAEKELRVGPLADSASPAQPAPAEAGR
jgi:hypothetical protein